MDWEAPDPPTDPPQRAPHPTPAPPLRGERREGESVADAFARLRAERRARRSPSAYDEAPTAAGFEPSAATRDEPTPVAVEVYDEEPTETTLRPRLAESDGRPLRGERLPGESVADAFARLRAERRQRRRDDPTE